MKKIKSLFKRNYLGDRLVYNEIVPGSEWVINGEGKATVKYDGTCCLIKNGKLYKRYDAKKGKRPPADFVPAQEKPDEITKHWPGWVPVGNGPGDKWHRAAFEETLSDGTYELIGPKIQGNPYDIEKHMLIRHGFDLIDGVPRDFDGLKNFFKHNIIEGIVWHHINGDMVKIKRKDFGYKWPKPHASSV